MDWLDYPFTIWTINQNLDKIKTLNFLNFFNTNSFYPHKMTLLFSDVLLPQSLIALPLSYLFGSPILVFNIVFIITFVLNYLSSYIFWKQIFKKDLIAFFGSLFIVFSVYTHYLLVHFQMLCFWPYFLSLYFLFKNEEKKDIKNIFFVGLFLSVQFLTSSYISIFLIFTIFVYFILKLIFSHLNRETFKNLFLIFFIFALIDGVFIKGYIDVQRHYGIKRDIGEHINYSAHVTDYLFSTHIKSAVHQSSLLTRWNSFDKHRNGENMGFPGFLLIGLSLLGLFKVIKSKTEYRVGLELASDELFFFTLAIAGLLFSFGPRLNFNGSYVHIPSIYALFIKIPPFNLVRSLARWGFIFYFGLAYFALSFLDRIKKREIFFLIFIFFILEYLPFNLQAHKEEYLNSQYTLLKNICKREKKVLLELPVTHFSAGKNIIDGLNYISKVQLAGVYHKCYLVNGYSGFDIPTLQLLQGKVDFFLDQMDINEFTSLIKKNGINIVKFNPEAAPKDRADSYLKFMKVLNTNLNFKKISQSAFEIE